MTRERWRDAGGGVIQCEVTGRRARLLDVRTTNEDAIHMMRFTSAEWSKLERLALARSTVKRTVTPVDCVRDFIERCQPGGSGWKVPGS